MSRQAAAVLGAIAVGMAFGAGPAAAADRFVSVSGTCTRTATPDRAAIVVTADFLEPDVRSASKKATESYERVRDAVKRLNLEDLELQTVEYSLNEAKEWQKDRAVSKGFRARIGLRISSSQVQRMGEVIAIAAREGIRDVGALSSYLSEKKMSSEHMACLADASKDARAKAEQLAKALSARVGQALEISEAQAYVPKHSAPIAMTAMGAMADRGAPAPEIEAGKQEISVSVNAKFALE